MQLKHVNPTFSIGSQFTHSISSYVLFESIESESGIYIEENCMNMNRSSTPKTRVFINCVYVGFKNTNVSCETNSEAFIGIGTNPIKEIPVTFCGVQLNCVEESEIYSIVSNFHPILVTVLFDCITVDTSCLGNIAFFGVEDWLLEENLFTTHPCPFMWQAYIRLL